MRSPTNLALEKGQPGAAARPIAIDRTHYRDAGSRRRASPLRLRRSVGDSRPPARTARTTLGRVSERVAAAPGAFGPSAYVGSHYPPRKPLIGVVPHS